MQSADGKIYGYRRWHGLGSKAVWIDDGVTGDRTHRIIKMFIDPTPLVMLKGSGMPLGLELSPVA